MTDRETDSWQSHLLAELAASKGAALPLRPLLAERLAQLRPQQLFEQMQCLLEGGAEMVCSEGEYRLVEGRPGRLSRGEWVYLAAAVAEAAASA
jgi:hypothetical protein